MKREDLFDYKENKEWIEQKKSKIEGEYESIQKMIANYKQYTRKNPEMQDAMKENLAILLDMKLEALNFTIQLEQNLKKVDDALLKVKQPYRNILTDMYVNGNSLVSVANHMNYNYKDMCMKHGKALKMYDNL